MQLIINKILQWIKYQPILAVSIFFYVIFVFTGFLGTYHFRDQMRFWGINSILYYLAFMLFSYWFWVEFRILQQTFGNLFLKIVLYGIFGVGNLFLAFAYL